MTEAPKTVFVTKYALSEGIKEVEVVRDHGMGGLNGATVKWPGAPGGTTYMPANAYALTKEGAATMAAAMRDAKLASLAKQVAKLKAMTF